MESACPPGKTEMDPIHRLGNRYKFVLEGIGKEERRSAIRLLLDTRQRAPFMMSRVMGLIARQYLEAAEVLFLRETIEAQILLESREGFKLPHEPTVFFVPEAFTDRCI